MPLLSRVADSVYWIARYIERAENVARFIGVNLNLQIDLPLAPGQQWQPLIETGGDAALFKERFGEATQARVIEFLAYDHENPNSIASCLRAARENARSVRGRAGRPERVARGASRAGRRDRGGCGRAGA